MSDESDSQRLTESGADGIRFGSCASGGMVCILRGDADLGELSGFELTGFHANIASQWS